MVTKDNEIEECVFTQMAYRENTQRNALRSPVSIEAGVPRAWTLADAKVSEEGYHCSS